MRAVPLNDMKAEETVTRSTETESHWIKVRSLAKNVLGSILTRVTVVVCRDGGAGGMPVFLLAYSRQSC